MLKFPKPTRRPKRKRKRDEAHLVYIRSLPCCVPGCKKFARIDPHHVRTAANSGTALKPMDTECVPLCRIHHDEHDRLGRHSFQAKYGLDLAEIARGLAVRPPPDLL